MMQQIIARFPGVSCAWTDADGHIVTACHGLSDKEAHLPVDEATIFPACSISKFVTALCIMKLQAQGLLDIDMPVNTYLRQWKLLTPQGQESPASISALLCHTAGIVDGDDGFYGHRRNDPVISLMDILEGRTTYNNRPVRAEKPVGTTFEYSDAGYCILQLLIEEVTRKSISAAAKDILFDALGLQNTFFASAENLNWYESHRTMATGYDGDESPIPGRFPLCPDLAASGMWTTPTELVRLGKEFIASLNGHSSFLTQASAQAMATPVEAFPWTGLGLFLEADTLTSQGWGENGQCMLKMNRRTGAVSGVMTNRNPEVDQEASGVAALVEQQLHLFS